MRSSLDTAKERLCEKRRPMLKTLHVKSEMKGTNTVAYLSVLVSWNLASWLLK